MEGEVTGGDAMQRRSGNVKKEEEWTSDIRH